jgi:hypothetical protein
MAEVMKGLTVITLRSWKRNSHEMFVYNPEDDFYTAKVNSVMKLNLVAKFVAIGVSFRQASKLYHSVKEENPYPLHDQLMIMKLYIVCCIVCAVNLQYLKELFKKIRTFLIGLDAENNAGLSYLDILMRWFFKGDIQNLHLLAIPMQEQHQLDLVMKRAFNKLCNEKFLNTLTSVTGRLRRQQNLIADMKSACPTFCHSMLDVNQKAVEVVD